MTISLRLDPDLAAQLEAVAERHGVSKSELIRQCPHEFLGGQQNRPDAWELGKDLFGKVGSGQDDLSRNRKQIVKERLHARTRRR